MVLIKPLGEDFTLGKTPGSVKPFQVSLVEPVAYQFQLIVWHGGSDAALSVNSTIEYMTNMEKSVGAENAVASTRFYVAPGVDHCEGGVGADKTDLLTALDQWVTKGVAPANLIARKLDANGAVTLTLPLCQYPQYPRYTGPANNAAAAKLAKSYTCTPP